MARFIHWSDLHTEFGDFNLPDLPKDIDALLLAGDTGVGRGHLDFLWKAWSTYGIPIISIWGNHELYNTNFERLHFEEKQRLAKMHDQGADIRVLHGEVTEVNGVPIFGATLWTDFQLYPAQDFMSKRIAKRRMNDFSRIKWDSAGTPFTPDLSIELHNEQRAKLVAAMAEHQGRNLIAMTHHMPTEAATHPAYRNDELTPAFCSNLEPEILQYHPAFWIFGHTHAGIELDIETEGGITRLRHNPRGYPSEPTSFNALRIIDTDNPELKYYDEI